MVHKQQVSPSILEEQISLKQQRKKQVILLKQRQNQAQKQNLIKFQQGQTITQQRKSEEIRQKELTQQKQQQATLKQTQNSQQIQVSPSLNVENDSEEDFKKIIITTPKAQQQLFVKQQDNFQILQQFLKPNSQQQLNLFLQQKNNLNIPQTVAISSEQHNLLQQQQTTVAQLLTESLTFSEDISTLQQQKQQFKPKITNSTSIQTATNQQFQMQQIQSSKIVLPPLTQNNLMEITSPIGPPQTLQKTTNRVKAQPPGIRPPNNFVIKQLNNAENFMEIVEKLKLRQILRRRRQRREIAKLRFFALI